jgi:hypothetical protein
VTLVEELQTGSANSNSYLLDAETAGVPHLFVPEASAGNQDMNIGFDEGSWCRTNANSPMLSEFGHGNSEGFSASSLDCGIAETEFSPLALSPLGSNTVMDEWL